MTSRTRILGLALGLVLAACQGETVGESSGGGGSAGQGGAATGGTGASGGSAGAGGATGGTAGTGGSTGGAAGAGGGGVHGPGKFGSLPSGYCCTQDSECRYRRCTDFGGVKICSDECDSNDGCNTAQSMTCGASFYCEPVGTPSCIPADQWVNGSKKIGACCAATGDGHSGQECEANRCVAVGDLSNPFICTQPCSGGCPPQYQCLGGLFCAPVATLYTCQ